MKEGSFRQIEICMTARKCAFYGGTRSGVITMCHAAPCHTMLLSAMMTRSSLLDKQLYHAPVQNHVSKVHQVSTAYVTFILSGGQVIVQGVCMVCMYNMLLRLHVSATRLHKSLYIYIYIERERERER